MIVILLGISQVHATTFYVDFVSGNDSNPGLSNTSAWKRSPGDPAAVGVAASTALRPGDTVLFKGGVLYRGTISVNASGTSGNPITYKGDGWGTEKARLEGADVWQGSWTACPSQAFALGNPNFARIYYTAAPAGYSSFLTGLYEDGDFLWYSQGPDLADPFYYDNNYQYYQIPQGGSSIRQTRTSITDTTRFTQADAGFWSGAHATTWIQGNLVASKPVTSFDPATDTVFHEDLGANPYTDRTSYYSMLNHVSLISRPGEYAYDPVQNRLYVWPRNSDSAANHEYAVQVRDTAFTIPSRSHVAIEGFSIQHFAQGVYASSTTATGVTVRNNEITRLRSANKYAIFVNATQSLVEGNRVTDCMRAVGILSSATGIIIRSNYVSRTSRQGIWFMGATRSQIANNIITDIQGSHANALSIYSGASDILVAQNVITLANSPITYEDSSDITFFGNVVDGRDQNRPVSEWFGASGRIAFINNTFVRNPDSAAVLVLTPGSAQYVFVNNLIDGGGPSSSVHDYNLFLGTPGWSLASHEEVSTSLTDVFVGPATGDWRPKAGGPAVDTGTNPSQYLPTSVFPDFDFLVDVNGNPRAMNGVWDRGAFESGSGGVVTPTITVQPLSATVAVGQTATFAVVASGSPPLAYRWQRNGANIAGATEPTYTTPATTLSDGGSNFRVVVSNSAGSVTSASATLTISTTSNAAPTVVITTPAAGTTYSAPASVTIEANASDSDGSVATVEFYHGAIKLGEDATSPYSYIWSGVVAGSYSLTARATDNLGATTISSGVSITVSTSGTLKAGDRVAVNSDPSLRVRSTAALAGTVVGDQLNGALGTIIGGPVSADGYTWWQIDYVSAPDGWSIEGTSTAKWLVLDTAARPAPPTGLRVVGQ